MNPRTPTETVETYIARVGLELDIAARCPVIRACPSEPPESPVRASSLPVPSHVPYFAAGPGTRSCPCCGVSVVDDLEGSGFCGFSCRHAYCAPWDVSPVDPRDVEEIFQEE